MRERTKWVLLGILQALILLSVLADLILGLMLWARVDALQETPMARHSLPCEAIPVRFVLDEPVCADKLLRAMNVTNVHIRPNGIPTPGCDHGSVPGVSITPHGNANRSRTPVVSPKQ